MIIDCIIPARAGSKSIKKKNIKLLGDYPLLAYSIAAAKLTPLVRETIVSTDSQEMADIALKYGAKVPYLRPETISQDDSLDIEFFKYHVEYLKKNNLPLPDFILHLRPTTPLRDIKEIQRAIETLLHDNKATSLRSAHKTHLTPYKMFQKNDNYFDPFLESKLAKEFYNLPRQAFPDAYIPNGHIDIVKTAIFENSDILHGDYIYLFETQTSVDIDVLDDFKEAKKLLEREDYAPLSLYLKGCV